MRPDASYVSPGDDPVTRQHYWEGENVSLGIERYQAAQSKSVIRNGQQEQVPAEVGQTTPGQAIIRDICENVVPAVERARQQAIDGITAPVREGRGGAPVGWWWLIAYLPADALAYITARSLLSAPSDLVARGNRLTTQARHIGRAIQDEIEFRKWRSDSRREAKEGKDDGVVDVALLLMNRVKGDVTRKQFSKWRTRLDGIEQLGWTEEQQIAIGTKLIQIVVESGGGWISVSLVRRGSKTIRTVRLTQDGMAALETLDEKSALSRPYLMPMVAPPQPWARKHEGD